MARKHFAAALAAALALGAASCTTRTDSVADRCDAMIAELVATHDYTGDMRPCLGTEDDPRVAAVLDDRGAYYPTGD